MMCDWITALKAAEILDIHFNSVTRLIREGEVIGRQIPWKGSATRFVWECDRASVEERREKMNRLPPAPDAQQWMPIAEAQKVLKMTRHGIKRRMRMSLLDFTHYGPPEAQALYVSRAQVEQHVEKRPEYVRRTHWEAPPIEELGFYWLAGFFDGEGCVQIRKTNGKYHCWVLSITVTNTYRPAIDELLDRFGGKVSERGVQYEGHKQCWVWRAYGDEAQVILKRIRPYLKVKHAQADIAIEFQDRIQSRRYSQWDRYSSEEHEWRVAAWTRLSDLNRRGRPLMDESVTPPR